MGRVVMYGSVSVDGFIADDDDQPGPLFDWLLSGDVPLDESGALKVSQTSYDYTRPYWDQIGATIVGRHVFDITLHAWDLARSIGASERLAPDLVDIVLDIVEHGPPGMGLGIVALGHAPADASPQDKLLDLTGRGST